jgi:predicted ester cyclase
MNKQKQTGSSVLILLLLLSGAVYSQSNPGSSKSQNKTSNMTIIQNNKEVIRKLYEEVLNKKDLTRLENFISADYTGIRGLKGNAAFEAAIGPLINAFPDIHWNIEEMIGEADKVIVRWKWTGTNTQPYLHFMVTNKTISNEAIAIYELRDGKVTSARVQTDRVGFLQEMGALPSDLALVSNKQTGKEQIQFIDKFFVPASAKEEFMRRVKINRDFLKTLPGFIKDEAYERTDENGNIIFVTIAVWENEEVIKKAKEAVQAAYKKEGFNMAAFLEQSKITMDRGLYKKSEN